MRAKETEEGAICVEVPARVPAKRKKEKERQALKGEETSKEKED